jgi:NitT/TauT family transport system permease protein
VFADTTTGRGTAETLAALDTLSTSASLQRGRGRVTDSFGRSVWAGLWPRVLAVTSIVVAWQFVVWSGWRPDYVLPGPTAVGARLAELTGEPSFWSAVATTVRRGLTAFVVATIIGTAIGFGIARSSVLRRAAGSLMAGLQSMPSIAWFPIAILLFQLSESAIFFVVVLGAAPSIAGGLLAGVDLVPPLLTRAGYTMGARGFALYRHVIAPAALPTYVAGLRSGWAFAWRSLMAGELLVVIANRPSLGARLQFARELADTTGLLALMVVILVIGIAADQIFSTIDQRVRSRRGLTAR